MVLENMSFLWYVRKAGCYCKTDTDLITMEEQYE